MSTLVHQRCFQHSLREAVARCPECRHFYCRECITEHDDRVICASCLRKLTIKTDTVRRSFAWVLPVIQFSVGICSLWFCFYFFGSTLLSIPSDFHEGSVWVDKWWSNE